MLKNLMPAFALLLVLAAAAYAGDVGGRPEYRGDPEDHCRTDWGWSGQYCSTPRISVCPQGDFELIGEGCDYGDEYIWIEALHEDGRPFAGIPVTDFFLQACDPAEELCLCTSPFLADSVTNADGRTTISGPFAGGGCALNGLYLRIQGIFVIEWPYCIQIACRDIIIVSVDLNADCLVNLSDLAAFGLSYNYNLGDIGYNTCCDYNDDDHCNLSDFAFMGAHYQHACEQRASAGRNTTFYGRAGRPRSRALCGVVASLRRPLFISLRLVPAAVLVAADEPDGIPLVVELDL